MQALALDVKVLNEDDEEIELRDINELEAITNFNVVEFEDDRKHNRSEEYFAEDSGFSELDEYGQAVKDAAFNSDNNPQDDEY